MTDRVEHTGDCTLYLGDCLEVMPTLGLVDAVVADPPYHLTSIVKRFGKADSAPVKPGKTGAYARASSGFMGQTWDGGDIAFRAETWRLVRDLMKPGAHLLSFSGCRTYHRMAVAIEDSGFEIRDTVHWLFGSGFPKSHNAGDGWGTALKPAHELICLARKALIGTVAENMQEHGTGAINIDECRIDAEKGGRPAVEVHAMRADVQYRRNALDDSIQSSKAVGTTNEGRWPANVIHDGSNAIVGALPRTGPGGNVTGREPSSPFANIYGDMPDRSSGFDAYPDEGSVARFFYCAKATREDRDDGCTGDEKPLNWSSGDKSPGTFQSDGTKKSARNNHPTVKPTDLMRYLCRLITPPGGIILDPFMGSGSTGRAARLEGFKFIGIEKDPDYFEIACARIKKAYDQPDLFIEEQKKAKQTKMELE